MSCLRRRLFEVMEDEGESCAFNMWDCVFVFIYILKEELWVQVVFLIH